MCYGLQGVLPLQSLLLHQTVGVAGLPPDKFHKTTSASHSKKKVEEDGPSDGILPKAESY